MCVNFFDFYLDQLCWINESFDYWIEEQEERFCSKNGGGVC